MFSNFMLSARETRSEMGVSFNSVKFMYGSLVLRDEAYRNQSVRLKRNYMIDKREEVNLKKSDE
ncbi:hypothetical protein GCM10011607_34650 [Shewanella inventionis]|uniref:Transposase n=2 Tax=Shewanella TaxID=22 RepID=A0ABQ1JLC0_9GAMM|nr:hypothetical protein GCM10011607_34650 [Shewanella inventionis]